MGPKEVVGLRASLGSGISGEPFAGIRLPPHAAKKLRNASVEIAMRVLQTIWEFPKIGDRNLGP